MEEFLTCDLWENRRSEWTYCWQCKKWNGKHTETRGNNFPHPGLGDYVTISYRCYCNHTPPKCISIWCEFRWIVWAFAIFFRQINKIRAKYQSQKSNIKCRYQLLQIENFILSNYSKNRKNFSLEFSIVDSCTPSVTNKSLYFFMYEQFLCHKIQCKYLSQMFLCNQIK